MRGKHRLDKRPLTQLQTEALGRGGIEGFEHAEAIHEANAEALAQMINEAREDAIELAKALRSIRDAMAYPLQNKASILVVIDAALKGHVEANRSSGWDSSTWEELGR